jgi:cytochrome c-type biogenesis protein CcmE
MTHIRTKLSIAALVLIVAVGYLGIAGIRSGWVYYVQVDDFVANAQYQDQRVRLCGVVGGDEFLSSPALLTAKFELRGKTAQVPVEYVGVIPSTFKVGCEVVVEGKLAEDGVFRSDFMMTKCASKYQSEDHAKRLAMNTEAKP